MVLMKNFGMCRVLQTMRKLFCTPFTLESITNDYTTTPTGVRNVLGLLPVLTSIWDVWAMKDRLGITIITNY